MPELNFKPEPFPKAGRNNVDRGNRLVSKIIEGELGMDPTALTCDFGTPEMAEGVEIDPMTRQNFSPVVGGPPAYNGGWPQGKRTSGADPTPGMPGA